MVTVADLLAALGRLPVWLLIIALFPRAILRGALAYAGTALYLLCAAISLVAEAAFNLGKR